MESLVNKIKKLKNSKIKKIIDNRMYEFSLFCKKNFNDIFKELCFCILTANFTAERGIIIQTKIGNGFLTYSEKKIAKKLKELGHRFPNMRAKFIFEARQHIPELKKRLKEIGHKNYHNKKLTKKAFIEEQHELRDWIAKNIKGLGMKESSHFLRNICFKDVAILDFHIIDILVDNKVIIRPKTSTGKITKTLTPKKYLEIEKKLDKLCKTTNLSQAELDLYLWYLETGKVLK
jgi:N-glycosylase/DNA lyase